MVNIIIADDEMIERTALRQILERGLPDVRVVGEAGNGAKAVALAEQLSPDLILMDIQMPGTDGLSAIREIRGMQPDIRFIIVSAYDTFEYARQALRLEVNDYLLKPSKPDVIVDTVRSVVERIRRDKLDKLNRLQEMQRLQALLPVVEADLVTQMLFDHVHDVHLEDMLHLFGLHSFQSGFVMIVFLIPCHPSMMDRIDADRAYRRVKEHFRSSNKGWVGAMSGRQIPIVVCSETDRSYRAQASSIVRKLLQVCPDRDGSAFDCFIGIGGQYASPANMIHSYHEALLAAADTGLPSGHCFFDQLQLARDHTDESLLQAEKSILEQVSLGDGAMVAREFAAFIENCEASGKPVAETQHGVLEAAIQAYRLLRDMGVHLEKPLFSLQASNYKQLQAETRSVVLQMMDNYAALKQELTPDLYRKMKNYIVAHSQEDITLTAIADHVRLSPYYVSKLFKEQSGTNYIDFLTECRIDNAKKLMSDESKSLKEIAIDVGYRDPNYFSRVFKRTCGVAPTEYRKRLYPHI